MHYTNHKLVKTTPKPRATKNSKGELGPPLFFGSGVGVGLMVGMLASIDDDAAMFAAFFCPYPMDTAMDRATSLLSKSDQPSKRVVISLFPNHDTIIHAALRFPSPPISLVRGLRGTAGGDFLTGWYVMVAQGREAAGLRPKSN